MPRLKLKAAGNINGSELRRTGDPQKSTFHHAVHPGKCRAHDSRIAMEGFDGGGDLQTGVAPQGRIDLLEDEGGGIDWKPGGRSGQGAANFRRWEITALRAEGKHACAGGFGSTCNQNGSRTETVSREVHGGVARAGEVVGDKQASKGDAGHGSSMVSKRKVLPGHFPVRKSPATRSESPQPTRRASEAEGRKTSAVMPGGRWTCNRRVLPVTSQLTTTGPRKVSHVALTQARSPTGCGRISMWRSPGSCGRMPARPA